MFRSRITGVYFALITQALALIVSILFIGQQAYTGGTNGITNYTTIFGYPLNAPSMQLILYYASVAALTVAYLLCWWLISSRLGRLLVAMRDDENRVRFSGYDPALLKTLVFSLSAGIAGVAGALFTPQVGIISPTMMGIVPSIEIAIWVAVGGRGALLGAVDRRGGSERGQERPERVVPGGVAVLPGPAVHRSGAAVPRPASWGCCAARAGGGRGGCREQVRGAISRLVPGATR